MMNKAAPFTSIYGINDSRVVWEMQYFPKKFIALNKMPESGQSFDPFVVVEHYFPASLDAGLDPPAGSFSQMPVAY